MNDESQSRVASFVQRRGSPSFAAGVLGISLLKYGVGLYPSWNYMQSLAANWRDPLLSPLLRGPASYRLASATSAVAAGVLGLLSGRSYLAFHLVLACAAIVVPFAMPVVRRSSELRLAVAVLLVGGAVPPILLGWVGSYDPVTIGAGAVAALAVTPVVAFAGWFVFAFNHAPEAGIGLVVYAAVLVAQRRRAALGRVVVAASGWLAGFGAITALLAVWGSKGSRSDLADFYGTQRYIDNASDFLPLIMISALGVGWVFFTRRGVWSLPAAKVLVAAAALLSLASFTPLLGLDVTRVLAGVLWPGTLAALLLAHERIDAASFRRVAARAAPYALLLPILVVWDDQLVYPGIRQTWDFVGYLLDDPIPRSL
jgi:hypothetical protein